MLRAKGRAIRSATEPDAIPNEERSFLGLALSDLLSIAAMLYFSRNFFCDLRLDESSGKETVYLFLETPGGMTDATEEIVKFLQNHYIDLRVIIANAAKSNGTLIALAASEILMGPCSELGPIEPSVGGIPCTILTQEEAKARDFVLAKAAEYALSHSKQIAKKLLKSGMLKERHDNEIENVVEILTSRERFPSHGSIIDVNEAKALGLNVRALHHSEDLWKWLWLLYCVYDNDSQQNGYVKVFESKRVSSTLI